MTLGKRKKTVKRFGATVAGAGAIIFGLGLLFELRGHDGRLSVTSGAIMISVGAITYLILSTSQCQSPDSDSKK